MAWASASKPGPAMPLLESVVMSSGSTMLSLGYRAGRANPFFTWSVSVNTAVQLPSLPVPAVVAISRMGRACPPCLRP